MTRYVYPRVGEWVTLLGGMERLALILCHINQLSGFAEMHLKEICILSGRNFE